MLPLADQELIESLGYKKKLDEVDQAILVNADFLNKIVANPEIFGHELDDDDTEDTEGDEGGLSGQGHEHGSHGHSHSHDKPGKRILAHRCRLINSSQVAMLCCSI